MFRLVAERPSGQFTATFWKTMRKRNFLFHWLLILALCGLVVECANAQYDVPVSRNDSTNTILTRKNLITAGIVAHTAFTFALEYRWWWRGNYHPFGFIREGFWHDYGLGVDKVGHFYTHYVYFHALRNVLTWGGYDESGVLWASVVIPALYGLSLEVGDGYSSYLFSPEDLAADLLGIGYGVLQVKYPFMDNFKFKWSYYPSKHNINTFDHPFSEDYDGHIYWLSMNVHDLLPSSLKSWWPKFLNLAVGYGGKNITKGVQGPQLRKFAVALDYNLTLLPVSGETWDPIKNILDLFHLPAPGVRFIESESPVVKPLLLN